MITTVLFDMGGTLEDIWVDEQSEALAVRTLSAMLKNWGLDAGEDLAALKARVDAGWAQYARIRDEDNVERKPVSIWCDYALCSPLYPRRALAPHAEEIAHMWEITHYHRKLRPRVPEMLEGLQELGLKMGVVSNTAALFQVFSSLEAYGIRGYFRDVTLSSVTGIRKPDADIFTVALRQVRSEPCECVYVGDTVSRDVIGAKRAGFAAAIQICSKLTREKDASVQGAMEADYQISDIYDVYNVVKGLISR